MKQRFLIADDHVIVRRGLRNLLYDRFQAKDVKEVATCLELLQVLEEEEEPTMLLLDLQLTDGSSLDHLGAINQAHPDMHVLVYSMRSENVYAQRVIALGAMGYLSKESSEEEVVRAIRLVLRGKRYLSKAMQAMIQEKKPTEATRENPFSALSDREISVMNDLLSGLGVKHIAIRMGLQPSTVATYKARLFDKLGITNLMDLHRLAEMHEPSTE